MKQDIRSAWEKLMSIGSVVQAANTSAVPPPTYNHANAAGSGSSGSVGLPLVQHPSSAVNNPFAVPQAAQAAGYAPNYSTEYFEDGRLMDMLASRMRWSYETMQGRGQVIMYYKSKFSKVTAVKMNEDTAVVFLVAGGKALVIEDGLALFPSDALITQLRLLESNEQ